MSANPNCNQNSNSSYRRNSNAGRNAPIASGSSNTTGAGNAYGLNIFSGFDANDDCDSGSIQQQQQQHQQLQQQPSQFSRSPMMVRNRSRSRTRQFRLLATPGLYDPTGLSNDSMTGPMNVVVPSHINSDTSVLSSGTNITAMNVVSKSSLCSQPSDRLPDKSARVKEQQAEPVTPPSPCLSGKMPSHDTDYLRERLEKYRADLEHCGDAAKINGQLNEIFLRRLCDIEYQADGDTATKLITYQEWVDMLLQINEVIINNMEDLECEVAERLECMKQRIKNSCGSMPNENEKYRSDICMLMQLLKNAYHHDNWNTQGMEFQTVNPADVLGVNKCPQRNKTPSPCTSRRAQSPCDAGNTEQMDSRSRCVELEPAPLTQNQIYKQTLLKSCSGSPALSQQMDDESHAVSNRYDSETCYCSSCPKLSEQKDAKKSLLGDMEKFERQEVFECARCDKDPSACRENSCCKEAQPKCRATTGRASEDQSRRHDGSICAQNELPKCDMNIYANKEQQPYGRGECQEPCYSTIKQPSCAGYANTGPCGQTFSSQCSSLSYLSDNNLDTRLCTPKKTNSSQNNNANLRALAIEVAAKHDEICDLKRQLACLEDEIQKAQQKITLKDNVIKELRNDLKCTNAKLSSKNSCGCICSVGDPYLDMPPINYEVPQSSRSASTQVSAGHESCNQQLQLSNDDCSHYDSLSNADQVEQQKLKALEAELNELFEVTKDFKRHNLEYHRKRLSDIFQKSEAEKTEAYRKLDFIRRQLIDLEASGGESCKRCTNDSDSGFSSKCENDQDAKIMTAVRKRLKRLNDTVFELKTFVQQLQIENNELSTCLTAEKSFAQRNSDTLKELADMLCSLTGSQFSYDDIYSSVPDEEANPFCKAIIRMKCDFEEAERSLKNSVAKKCKQIEELQQSTMCNEHDLQKLHSSTKLCSNAGVSNNRHNTKPTETSDDANDNNNIPSVADNDTTPTCTSSASNIITTDNITHHITTATTPNTNPSPSCPPMCPPSGVSTTHTA